MVIRNEHFTYLIRRFQVSQPIDKFEVNARSFACPSVSPYFLSQARHSSMSSFPTPKAHDGRPRLLLYFARELLSNVRRSRRHNEGNLSTDKQLHIMANHFVGFHVTSSRQTIHRRSPFGRKAKPLVVCASFVHSARIFPAASCWLRTHS